MGYEEIEKIGEKENNGEKEISPEEAFFNYLKIRRATLRHIFTDLIDDFDFAIFNSESDDNLEKIETAFYLGKIKEIIDLFDVAIDLNKDYINKDPSKFYDNLINALKNLVKAYVNLENGTEINKIKDDLEEIYRSLDDIIVEYMRDLANDIVKLNSK